MKVHSLKLTIFLLLACEYMYAESNEILFLYAPTRSTNILTAVTEQPKTSVCKMCKAIEIDNPTEFYLARTNHFTILLNLFPYGKGHILIVDNNHGTTFDNLPAERRNELTYLISVTTTCIKEAFKCPGLNIGYNEGQYSGASVLEHLHIHLLPRFEHHEKSFIHTISNTQIVQWDFKAIQQLLLPLFAKYIDTKDEAITT